MKDIHLRYVGGLSVKWRVAEAKQRFSEVLRAAESEPQLIFNRDRLAAAVVGAADFEAMSAELRRARAPLGEVFAEVRALCAEEGWELEVPERADRPDPWSHAAG